MSRSRTAALTIGSLLSSALVLTAQPAAAAATPANVRVAWADPQHSAVRISWTDDGSANVVRSEVVDLGVGGRLDERVAADAPNELVVPAGRLPVDALAMRIAVFAGTDGQPLGTPGWSVFFDTDRPDPVSHSGSRIVAGHGTRVEWQTLTSRDRNPSDPLDVPAGTTLSFATTRAGTCRWDTSPLAPSTRSLVLPARSYPYLARISTANEWGEEPRQPELSVGHFQLVASIPRTVGYGRGYVVTGGVWNARVASCDGVPYRLGTEYGQPLVVLQRRTDANSPWTWAGSAYADDNGRFRIPAIAAGSVQLRAWVPTQTVASPTSSAYGTATAPVSSITRYRVDAARFVDHTATYRQRVTATLDVGPETDSWTMLQRWTGRAWVNVVRMPLRDGRASYGFTATQRGVTGWRFYLPAAVYRGQAIAATVTGSFILGVR
jgi:hypothetical protein